MEEEEEALIPQTVSKKSQIKQINDFKLRVLDYVSIFLDSNPITARTPQVACALADAMKIAVQDGNMALYQKAKNILSELYKSKELQADTFGDEEVQECASKMLEKMLKVDMKRAEGYKLVLMLCLKILESQGNKAKLITRIIKTLLQGFLTKTTKSLQINFFMDYFGQHLDVGWNLILPLIKLIFPRENQGARTEMQRKVALKLVIHIVKRTSKTNEPDVLEKALGKYESICKLVEEALEVKGWKKPVKYWLYFLNIFTAITSTLSKGGMADTEQVRKIKAKVDAIIEEDKKAAGLKGKAKELEKLLKLQLFTILMCVLLLLQYMNDTVMPFE
eukprot:TRINITY_DN135293_c2_g1_i1.p3 TRINITY_DN135293_c2_g1~~TRINITY_DN135293_c2_g1_i1.p3  ORF type:complete len:334 (-),score=63.45 TRINITY_DN135293_c2_g1_i1:25-1026(-)